MKAIWLVGLSVVVAGCSGGKGPDAEPDSSIGPSRSAVNGPANMSPPDFEKRTNLRMVRNGEYLRVGDSIEDALRVFKAEKNAFKLTEMPPGWKDPDYQCAGWDAGSTGFGTITYDDRVALALYHEDGAKEQRLQSVLDDYYALIGGSATTSTGSRVRYWFWDEAPQRLMICAVQVPGEDGVNISIALGDAPVMNLFGMRIEAADKDRQASEKMFQRRLDEKKKSDATDKSK